MNELLAARRFTGRAPFEEAWFLEGSLDAERAFWIRYTTSAPADAPPRTAVWAAIVEGDAIRAVREEHPWEAPVGGALVAGPLGSLSAEHATGRVGPLAWDLHLDGDASHDHLPARLARLSLSGRHYASPGTRVRVGGNLVVDDLTLTLHDAPAVLGHIWGARANTRAWAWAHCAAFDLHTDAFIEVLSARLTVGPLSLPWATSAVVEANGVRRTFTRTRSLFRIDSHVGERHWSLSAEDGPTRLRADFSLPGPERVARVGLHHANGRRTRVLNSPFASAHVRLLDPEVGDVSLVSHRASLELAREGEVEAPHMRG